VEHSLELKAYDKDMSARWILESASIIGLTDYYVCSKGISSLEDLKISNSSIGMADILM
jgi:hypothetical protein